VEMPFGGRRECFFFAKFWPPKGIATDDPTPLLGRLAGILFRMKLLRPKSGGTPCKKEKYRIDKLVINLTTLHIKWSFFRIFAAVTKNSP
jgi:hypothetical protein